MISKLKSRLAEQGDVQQRQLADRQQSSNTQQFQHEKLAVQVLSTKPKFVRGVTDPRRNIYGSSQEYLDALNAWYSRNEKYIVSNRKIYDTVRKTYEQDTQMVEKERIREELAPLGLGQTPSVSNFLVVERYSSGRPKLVRAPKVSYVARTLSSRPQEYAEYSPYEAELSESGDVLRESSFQITPWLQQWAKGDGTTVRYGPMERASLQYQQGKPKRLIANKAFIAEREQYSAASSFSWAVAPEKEIEFDDRRFADIKIYEDLDTEFVATSGKTGRTKRENVLKEQYDFRNKQQLSFTLPERKTDRLGFYVELGEKKRAEAQAKVDKFNKQNQRLALRQWSDTLTSGGATAKDTLKEARNIGLFDLSSKKRKR